MKTRPDEPVYRSTIEQTLETAKELWAFGFNEAWTEANPGEIGTPHHWKRHAQRVTALINRTLRELARCPDVLAPAMENRPR